MRSGWWRTERKGFDECSWMDSWRVDQRPRLCMVRLVDGKIKRKTPNFPRRGVYPCWRCGLARWDCQPAAPARESLVGVAGWPKGSCFSAPCDKLREKCSESTGSVAVGLLASLVDPPDGGRWTGHRCQRRRGEAH